MRENRNKSDGKLLPCVYYTRWSWEGQARALIDMITGPWLLLGIPRRKSNGQLLSERFRRGSLVGEWKRRVIACARAWWCFSANINGKSIFVRKIKRTPPDDDNLILDERKEISSSSEIITTTTRAVYCSNVERSEKVGRLMKFI